MPKLMEKYDQMHLMHGLTLESAELFRRGGNSGTPFTRDKPVRKTNIRAYHGEPLKIQIEISAAGGGTSVIRQIIHSNEDLETLARAALFSMDQEARRLLIADIVYSQLVEKD